MVGVVIDFVWLLIDEDCLFLVCLNFMLEVKEVGYRFINLVMEVVFV